MDFFEKRPLFTILLSIIISFVVAFFLPNSVKLIVSAIALALFLFSFFLFRTFRKCAALMFLPFAIAMLNHFCFVHFAYLPMTDYQGKTIEVQGKTISEFTISDQSSYFVVRPDAILLEDKSSDVYGDVIVYCDRNTSEIEIGSHVSCLGNAFEDDSESLFHNYRITEKQFISMYSDEIKVLKPPSALNFRGWPVKLRDFFKNIYSDIFDDSSYALISGITLGERDLIDNATYADFKNSGVAHTLAVSGMHLAFLIAVLSFVLSAVCADLRVRAVLQLVLVWLFTALTGFSPSCCRAAVMLSIYLFGTLVHKEADSLTSLAVAVVLSCLYNPFAIFNPSLSLSAASTFGLLVLGGPIGSLMPSVKGHNLLARTIRFVTQTIAMSVAATVATLPIMVASFGSVSLLAPITNIVIIPVIEILFFIGLFAIIFAWCPPVTFVLSWLAKLLTDAACFVTSRIARLPFSTVATEGWQFWIALSILVLVIGVLIFWLREHKIILLCACVAVFSVGVGCGFLVDYLHRDNVEVSLLSVGQGNAALIRNGHRGIFIDCGGSGLGYREINNEIVRTNLKSIDAIFLTHLDSDHMRYAERLISTYPVDKIYLPRRHETSDAVKQLKRTAIKRQTAVIFINREREFSLWDRASLSVLTGHIDWYSEDENENSLVYRLSYGDASVLFVGDVRNEGEHRLTTRYQVDLESDILLVAHHGAEQSSSVEFLQYVNADYAVISVGENNGYDLPDKYVVKRIDKYAKTVLRTDETGTIRFVLDGENYYRKGQ